MQERTCPQCGTELGDVHANRKYCSADCGWRWRHDHGPACTVSGCDGIATQRRMCPTHYARWNDGRDITAPLKRRNRQTPTCRIHGCDRPSKQHNLCGAHAWRLRTKGDVQADKPIRDLGRKGNGYVDSNGYRKVSSRAEHRIIMERTLGRPLRKDEHVHHINGDRIDNRPENLELWIVRRQPPGQRVSDRVADAIEILERYAPELLTARDVQLRAA